MKEQDFGDLSSRSFAAPTSNVMTGVLDLPAEVVEPGVMEPGVMEPGPTRSIRNAPRRGRGMTTTVRHFAATPLEDAGPNRQAEQFYLQKQIQQRTQMVFVLEDGSRLQGVIEWYDRHCIKVRGRSRTLIYKSAIKYLYKAGEVGSAPSE